MDARKTISFQPKSPKNIKWLALTPGIVGYNSVLDSGQKGFERICRITGFDVVLFQGKVSGELATPQILSALSAFPHLQ